MPDNDGNLGISADEARRLIRATSGPELQSLIDRAAEIRARYFGKTVGLCAIANAKSGSCSEDCAFCAQSSRAEGTGVPIYALLPTRQPRLTPGECLATIAVYRLMLPRVGIVVMGIIIFLAAAMRPRR